MGNLSKPGIRNMSVGIQFAYKLRRAIRNVAGCRAVSGLLIAGIGEAILRRKKRRSEMIEQAGNKRSGSRYE